MTVVADTNVAVVANGQSPQASEDCIETCIDRLMQIVRGEVRLALDDQRRIIEEYRRNLSPGEQRGVGNAFVTWVEQNWANSQRCDLVPITSINDLENEFQEFPPIPTYRISIRMIGSLSPLRLLIQRNPPSYKPWITNGWISTTRFVGTA